MWILVQVQMLPLDSGRMFKWHEKPTNHLMPDPLALPALYCSCLCKWELLWRTDIWWRKHARLLSITRCKAGMRDSCRTALSKNQALQSFLPNARVIWLNMMWLQRRREMKEETQEDADGPQALDWNENLWVTTNLPDCESASQFLVVSESDWS